MSNVKDDLELIGNLVQSNRLDDAEIACRKVLETRKDDAVFTHLLGRVLFRKRDVNGAREQFEKSTSLNPRRLDWIAELADIYYLDRNVEKLLPLQQRLVQAKPNDARRLAVLAQLFIERHQPGRAFPLLRRAVKADPKCAAAHWSVANALLLVGKEREAVAPAAMACQLDPKNGIYRWTHGNACMGALKYIDARRSYIEALKSFPKDCALMRNVALATRESGRFDESLNWLRKALEVNPEYLEAHVSLGTAYRRIGRFDESLKHFDHVLKVKPDHAEALSGKSFILMSRKDTTLSRDIILPHLKGDETDVNIALAFGRIAPGMKRELDAARILIPLGARKDLPAPQRTAVLFLVADLLDSIGHYEDAWHYVQLGNKLKNQLLDRQGQLTQFNQCIQTFTRNFLLALPKSTIQTERPIFIVGMPRSGTTLVEQILASHPQVFGAGELVFVKHMIQWARQQLKQPKQPKIEFPATLRFLNIDIVDKMAKGYLRRIDSCVPENRKDVRFVTDKLPHNFLYLGILSRVFPHARFIHCVRDPRDTCLSIFFQNFTGVHTYAYDLDDLGWYYRHYQRLMTHWHKILPGRIYDVRYEDMVENPEEKVRGLLKYAGLEWDDRCMKFYETRRDVTTASYDQVVKPIYNTSVGRWKHYEKHLGPLFTALKGEPGLTVNSK